MKTLHVEIRSADDYTDDYDLEHLAARTIDALIGIGIDAQDIDYDIEEKQ